MADKNTSGLAGEFLVAGELSRRGYPVSVTMGNAKSVDICAETQGGKWTTRVDAKAIKTKTSWPIREDAIKDDLYYIFVHLQTEHGIKKDLPPEYFIVRGDEIKSKKPIRPWRSMPGIPFSALNTDDYKSRWDKLPQP